MPRTGCYNLFTAFFRLGLTSFGGPAMVAYIRELSVVRKKWLDEESFKHGVSLCQAIPGATAMQMAGYVGLQIRGLKGAFVSFAGFGLPAFLFMTFLAALYSRYHILPEVKSIFNGLQVIVTAIVLNATYSFGKGSVTSITGLLIVLFSAALFFAGVTPFLIILMAAFINIVIDRNRPESHATSAFEPFNKFQLCKGPLTIFLFGTFFGVLIYFLNTDLFSLAVIMAKIDLFAFGGGFSALPLMFHEIVTVKAWLSDQTFMDGIALGQVTPGPIVITAAFVGYLVQGLAGAVTATLAIFTPSFFMLVALAPLYERMKGSPRFLTATQGILSSFVGLLIYISIQFAMLVPWDIIRISMVIAALIALLGKVDLQYVVLAGACISLFIF